ncbi:O-methyltransferase [Ferdinandcohnia quinoae]|uniref:tRNA 5-hydroxyuridine methyltransferase n=1 Tax=Fredinandcohnia quinoae TaxID=2918902 RepID=A0AAW5ECI3_9BACI|nr:O-methyltransferase [Fredinandcohnia sp. SECRCQ15]MCH1627400.1 O-methyltransferase [Fredinandcohnia sp. SECRCQ15]
MNVDHSITAYIESLIQKRDCTIEEMELYAQENNVPIMELIGIECMLQILRISSPKRILEIGTAIGYSAIRMAKALPYTKIVTIERDEERYKKALQYISETGTSSQIEVIYGDALEVEETVKEKGEFDVLFIDAAKGQYRRFFETYEKYLSQSGMILTDNVLFKGLVAEDHIENKRIRSLVTKIKSYNEWLMAHPNYVTTIIPVGDGIAISKKRGE